MRVLQQIKELDDLPGRYVLLVDGCRMEQERMGAGFAAVKKVRGQLSARQHKGFRFFFWGGGGGRKTLTRRSFPEDLNWFAPLQNSSEILSSNGRP